MRVSAPVWSVRGLARRNGGGRFPTPLPSRHCAPLAHAKYKAIEGPCMRAGRGQRLLCPDGSTRDNQGCGLPTCVCFIAGPLAAEEGGLPTAGSCCARLSIATTGARDLVFAWVREPRRKKREASDTNACRDGRHGGYG